MARNGDGDTDDARGVSRRGFLSSLGTGALSVAAAGRLEASETPPQGPVDGLVPVTLTVNGRDRRLLVEPRWSLAHVLREELGLTGTNVGCDTSSCGACTVHLDGESVKACTLLAAQADGCEVTTIEGLAAADGAFHPVQESFRKHHGLQCGYCTPGMVMAAVSLLRENPRPTSREVREGLEGNLCRCTGYHNIVKAVMSASEGSAS